MPSVGDPVSPSLSSSSAKRHPRTLLVDNYDSYTFNLLQLLIQQCLATNNQPDTHILVIRNNQYSWAYVRDNILPYIDNVIISPGPGTPEKEEDFGICRNLILHSNFPVLGICLGHQGIADCFGGRVVRASVPVHGQRCLVELVDDRGDNDELFRGIPKEFMVVRYHSLVVEVSDQLEVLARAKGHVAAWNQGIEQVETRDVMALKVVGKPIWGVQFHPESVCSEYGDLILSNFHRLTPVDGEQSLIPEHVCRLSLNAVDRQKWAADDRQMKSAVRWSMVRKTVRLSDHADIGGLFIALFGDQRMPLWLDSANANANNNNSTNNNDNNNANSRSQIHPKNNNISIMASGATKGSVTVRYNLQTRTISVLKFSPNGSHDDLVVATEKLPPGDQQSFWTWMQRVVDCTQGAVGNAEQVNGDDGDLEFIGGWIGYFAYEMAAECLESSGGPGIFNETDAPDAQLTFVDRCVVIDHRVYPPCAHVVALVDSGHGHGLDKQQQQQQQQQTKKDRCSYDSPEWSADLGFSDSAQANAWVAETTHLINQWLLLASANSSETNSNSSILSNQQQQQSKQLERSVDAVDVEFAPWQSRAEYLDSISEAKDLITQGESYEVCLTNQFRVHLPSDRQVRCAKDMLRLYFSMRMTNPAPYGAVLWYDDLKYGIASCSPERFLKVAPESQANANVDSDFECRRVEMKPIKGTCLRESVPEDPGLFGAWLEEDNRRKEVLRTDVKEQAENLMIVDLIRHDLNWIAKDGLVRVPGLMQIESFRTVHQMVTTVEALVDQRISHIAALAHCFPPGSMTGAPKLRTTQIIAALERHPRGAYSGCLGYFSACGRYSDWNVIIRTAVVHSHGSAISVGAGGALTILSDPNMEWAEVKTKLWSAVPGIKRYIG